MRSGKDTAANYLAKSLAELHKPTCRISFAYNVKMIVATTFGVTMDFIEEWKVKKEIPPGFDCTIREALQQVGDGFRKIRGTIWMDLALATLTQDAICSDVRYINELKRIKQEDGGITVLLHRPGWENDDPNGSEAQIRPVAEFYKKQEGEGLVQWKLKQDNRWPGDAPYGAEFVDVFLRNDGAVEDLYEKVDRYVVPLVLRGAKALR
jgi:hypothetical protein